MTALSEGVPALGSLRTKIVIVLVAAAAMAAASAALLVHGLDSSRQLIAKAQAAQTRTEEYLVLVARVSGYGNAVISATDNIPGRATAFQHINDGRGLVVQVFDRLEELNVAEVASETGDAKTAAATKGLMLARMRAQFDQLHNGVDGDLRDDDPGERVRGRLDMFGLGFSPMLAQAIEDERRFAAGTRTAIDDLRSWLTTIAAALTISALGLAVVLYVFAGKPLLRRIAETISGAEAISAGRLDTRLQPTGRDELTALMNAFNAMAASFGAREADLRQGQRELQETVDRQTADLRVANDRLEQTDLDRRRFFSDVSHELRTPLTVIQGEAEFNLKPKAKPTAAHMRKSFETILKRVGGLRRRVDDMLRIARSESGKLELATQSVNLNTVIADAAELERDLCERHGIAIAARPCGAPVIVNGDPDWLRQVVSGLVSNSVSHSKRGSAIALMTGVASGKGSISVEDEGSGVNAQDLPHVFDRFSRGVVRSASAEGFGVGLSFARWVVEEHGGTMAIANNERKPGATVRIELPLAAQRRRDELA